MKIYELDTLKVLSVTDLKDESGVIASENIDLREVLNLVSSGKYSSFDEVEINENTSEELLDKFSKEHLHTDDEVRFMLSGRSVFDVRGSKDQWIRIEVSEKDFITIPTNLYHRFFAPVKNVKAIRLFSGKEGWIPIYRESVLEDEMQVA
ncbi:MAG: cupin domain-containing protein [Candidatus Caenarcaniphilales bacterium]|nr:cupin domain-containing protein [Candidatus Caenarcaniphilales bacterium]